MNHTHISAAHDTAPVQRWLQPGPVFAGLFLFSLLAYLALIPVPRVDGQLIGSDGVGYYVYLRSLLFDGDLDFTNEYAYYSAAFPPQESTPIGRPANKYSVGTAVLWLPFYLLAHLLALAAAGLGLTPAPDGYGYLYQAAISIGSIVYGTAGFWLAYRAAARLFAWWAALAAVALLWLASNAIYYMVLEPSMSHMASLFAVALLLSLWFFWLWLPAPATPPTLVQAALLGAAGGLVLLVRLQDGIFLLLPYGMLLVCFGRALLAGQHAQARHWLLDGLLVAACTLLVFVPQLAAWQAIYGTWQEIPYTSDHDPAFYWLQPHLWGVTFSLFRGLFTWHPVYLLALVGLGALAQRDRWLALWLLLLLLLDLYIVAAWWAWWQGDAFGGRMLLNAMWVWVAGLAALLTWLHARGRLVPGALLLGGLLVLWNGLALVQYRLGFVPMDAPPTLEQMTIERILLPWRLLQAYLIR
jgi:hypothetical protein